MPRLTIAPETARDKASDEICDRLQSGDILYFPTNPIALEDADRAFLLSQKQVDASYHKNISYRPAEDRLKGVDAKDAAARDRTHRVLREFSRKAIGFMAHFFPSYARDW